MLCFCDTCISEGCESSLSPKRTALCYGDKMPAAGRGVSALLFQPKQRKKLNMIDLKYLKTCLGEIRSRIGSYLEEEKERIESQRLLGWPSKSLCVWVFGRPTGHWLSQTNFLYFLSSFPCVVIWSIAPSGYFRARLERWIRWLNHLQRFGLLPNFCHMGRLCWCF